MLVRLSDKELNMLALELRANEYRLRSTLTPLYLMEVLVGHAKDPSSELPTSLNTRQVPGAHSHDLSTNSRCLHRS